MSKKKKRAKIKHGWLCLYCQTIYNPTVKKCECLKETVAVVDVIEGEDGELHLDWNKPLGLEISWGQSSATITGIMGIQTTDGKTGVTWYKMPPHDPNEPIYIYAGCGI